MAAFMALLARDTERFSEADFGALLDAEAAAARALYAAGTVRQIFGRGDRPGAVLMLEAASLDEARAAIDTLPFVERGMLTVEIIELRPYRGFATP